MNCSAFLLVGVSTIVASPSVFAQVCATGPDAFENNDDCSSAVSILPGTYPGLNVEPGDRDFFRVTVEANWSIELTAFHDATESDIDVYFFDPTIECDTEITGEGNGAGLAAGFSSNFLERVTWENLTGAPVDLVIEVRIWSGETNAVCNDYDLTIELGVGCALPDVFDPNDSCNTAVPLGSGQYFGLATSADHSDFFALELPDGAALDASIVFEDDDGDLDMYLWDPAIACDSAIEGQGNASNALALGFSSTDDEAISYVNLTGGAQALILEVRVYNEGRCNTYDLQVTGATDGSTSVGKRYCVATPNSTGSTGTLLATGSATVVDDDLELSVSSLPVGVFGLFLAGQSAGLRAVGDGNLCLGGTIGRYQGPTTTFLSSALGAASMQLDLGACRG